MARLHISKEQVKTAKFSGSVHEQTQSHQLQLQLHHQHGITTIFCMPQQTLIQLHG
jgi:hypothetical protein